MIHSVELNHYSDRAVLLFLESQIKDEDSENAATECRSFIVIFFCFLNPYLICEHRETFTKNTAACGENTPMSCFML